MNTGAINICVQFLCGHTFLTVLGYVLKSGIARSCDKYMINILSNF